MILTPFPVGGNEQMGGKRRGVPVKTLKKILKKAGLKTTGKKAALTRRAKMAKLVKKGGKNGDEGMMVDNSQINAVETVVEDEEAAKEAAKKAEEAAKAVKGGRKHKSRSKKYFF